MTLQNICIFITAVISVISIVLSFANYWKSKPKIKIEIADKKWDCFFGNAVPNENKNNNSICIGGAQISIVNNSPVSINISEINLVIGKESLRIIDKNNSFWKDAMFFYFDDNGEWVSDGFGFDYYTNGISLPYKINAYDSITVLVLFHNFPIKYRKKCSGYLEMKTAIGKVRKKITLIEYDKNYQDEGYRDMMQYFRSLEKE